MMLPLAGPPAQAREARGNHLIAVIEPDEKVGTSSLALCLPLGIQRAIRLRLGTGPQLETRGGLVSGSLGGTKGPHLRHLVFAPSVTACGFRAVVVGTHRREDLVRGGETQRTARGGAYDKSLVVLSIGETGGARRTLSLLLLCGYQLAQGTAPVRFGLRLGSHP